MSIPLYKLEETTKNIISEVSALSGYGQSVVKECYEYLLLNWAIKIADNPGDWVTLDIPYLGSLQIHYDGDDVLPSGELTTNISYTMSFLPSFKKMVGEIEDEGYPEIVPLIAKKLENAVMVASTD